MDFFTKKEEQKVNKDGIKMKKLDNHQKVVNKTEVTQAEFDETQNTAEFMKPSPLKNKEEVFRQDYKDTPVRAFRKEDVADAVAWFVETLKKRIEENADYSGDYETLAIGDMILAIDRISKEAFADCCLESEK